MRGVHSFQWFWKGLVVTTALGVLLGFMVHSVGSFTWLVIVPFVTAIVVVHEGGHAIAAHLRHQKVSTLRIGIGPLLAQFKTRSGMEVQLGSLPFAGGHTKIIWTDTRRSTVAAIALAGPALESMFYAVVIVILVAAGVSWFAVGLVWVASAMSNLIPIWYLPGRAKRNDGALALLGLRGRATTTQARKPTITEVFNVRRLKPKDFTN